MRQKSYRVLGSAVAAAVMAAVGSASYGQQLTDAVLIGNKNWNSGGNPGFVITMDDRADGDLLTGRWKVNYTPLGSGRIDTPSAWQPYTRGQWNHVVATFERFEFTLPDNTVQIRTRVETYLNGVRVSDAVNVAGPGDIDTFGLGLNLNIGQDGTGNYRAGADPGGFLGRVDDVAVWRRPLTQAEVTTIWNGRTGSSLSALANSNAALATGLVGLYAMDNNVLDTASSISGLGGLTPKNGIWREIGEGPIDNATVAAYGPGLFGQAAVLNGSNYITIGDALAAGGFPADYAFGSATSFSFSSWFFEAIPATQFSTYTNATGTGLASTPGNWSIPPASWNETVALIIGGQNAAQNTITFDGAVGSKSVSYFEIGSANQTTNVVFEPGTSVIGKGAGLAIIGTANSAVNLTINSGVLNHWGEGEERRRLQVGQDGAVVNITLNGTGELSVGNYVLDSGFATGYRRPQLGGLDGLPRRGDDLLLGDGVNGAVNFTMNDNSFMHITDVMYVGDSNSTSSLTGVQNGSSTIIVNWDTRWGDDGMADGKVVNWTMNDDSKFIVARDHGLSESNGSGTGVINLTINDNAEFAAGDRIAIGAGGRHTVNVVLNGGLIRAGRLTPGPDLLVDDTGAPAQPARDNILLMGLNSNANLTVNGGLVSIQRSAWVGFNGGAANVEMTGGTFNILGIGSVGGSRLGNAPDQLPFPFLGAAAANTPWVDSGGDLYLSVGGTISRSAPVGIFTVGGDATLNVARDVIVGGTYYNANFSGVNAPGIAYAEIAVRGGDATVNVGGNLVFGGVSFGNTADYIVGGDVVTVLGARLTGPTHSPIQVTATGGRNGDLVIFSSNEASGTGDERVTSKVDVTVDVPYADYRPATGDSFTLVQYAGTRLTGLNGTGIVEFGRQGTFDAVTGSDVNGIDWTIQYDDANKRLGVVATKVYRLGNTDRDAADTVTASDFAGLVTGFGSTGGKIWADGDFTNDGNVDLEDFSIQRAALDNATGGSGQVEVPALIAFDSGRVLLQASGLVAGLQVKSDAGALDSEVFGGLPLASLVGSNPTVLSSDARDVAAASLTSQTALTGTTDLGLLYTGIARDLALGVTVIDAGTATYVAGNVAYLFHGDFNFDGILDAGDIDLFVEALLEATPFESFIASYGGTFAATFGATLDATVLSLLGDFSGDGLLDAGDIDGFVGAVLAGRPGIAAIPEPAAMGLLVPTALLLTRRRR